MNKKYTYDPRKKQMGGTPPPPVPGQAMISEAPTALQEFGSDVRSFIKYPFQSLRQKFQTGNLPYNFDKALEAGNVESQPMDIAFNMANIPGTFYKGVESLAGGKYGDAAMSFASMFPFARPLKASGLNPTTAKVASKVLNKGTKLSTQQFQAGGKTPIFQDRKLQRQFNIPTYNEFAERVNLQPNDTMFFGYGDDRTGMVLDQLRDARIQKRINEGQTSFNLPYLPQNFNIQNQVTLDPKRGEEGLRVYYETYNKDDLQGGGSVADTQSSDKMMTKKQIDAEMARINAAMAAEQQRLQQFQQNIQDQLPKYATAEERNRDPYNQKSVDSTEVIGPTFNYLSSLQEQNKNAYGCTSYGCGILAEAGAELHGEVESPDGSRTYNPGRLPIFSGNAMMNSMIQANPAGMGMEVINPQSYADLQPGDRIVSNYSTGGPEGGQHTQIFSGKFDDAGNPIIMENMGGSFRKGISSRPVEYDFADPESGYRVTRYTGNMQNLNNELARYQNMLDSGRYQRSPVAVSTLSPSPIVDVSAMPIRTEPLPLPPAMGKGGNVSWMFGGKRYSGTLIPSRETATHRYARTHNGKIKVLPKKKKFNTGGGTSGTSGNQGNSSGGGQSKFAKTMSAIPFDQLGTIGSGIYQASLGDDASEITPGEAGTAQAINMAGQGASLGMALGPVGAIVGGVLGAIGGGLLGKSQHKKLLAKMKADKENRLNNRLASQSAQDQVQAASVLSQYPTEGVDNYSYYAKDGGMIPDADYTVEGGELMMAPANNPPKTDKHGEVRKIGPNMFKFVGDTHDAPSGGIGVKGGNTGFGSQTNQALDAGFVFSDRLKTNVEDYLKNI
jgi:hypothetical protein